MHINRQQIRQCARRDGTFALGLLAALMITIAIPKDGMNQAALSEAAPEVGMEAPTERDTARSFVLIARRASQELASLEAMILHTEVSDALLHAAAPAVSRHWLLRVTDEIARWFGIGV